MFIQKPDKVQNMTLHFFKNYSIKIKDNIT